MSLDIKSSLQTQKVQMPLKCQKFYIVLSAKFLENDPRSYLSKQSQHRQLHVVDLYNMLRQKYVIHSPIAFLWARKAEIINISGSLDFEKILRVS